MADETNPNYFDADIKEAAKLYNFEEDELQKAVKAELLALVAKKIAQKIVADPPIEDPRGELAKILGVPRESIPE